MTVVMRNTDTGEMKVLETDSNSPEYQTMILERRTRDGRPLWEETGVHDYMALKDRLASGGIRPEDIGDAGQPFNTILGTPAPLAYTPSGEIDRLQPTATEVASNAGRADLSEGEEFVPTVLQEDGTMETTRNVSLQMPTPRDETPKLVDPEMIDTTPESDEMDDEVDDIYDEEEPDVAADDERVTSMTSSNTLEQLQTMAADRGLTNSGTKTELAQRIVEHDANAPSTEPRSGA